MLAMMASAATRKDTLKNERVFMKLQPVVRMSRCRASVARLEEDFTRARSSQSSLAL